MAPEQVEHPAEVDQRADIYSLGVVFYEMLTGELPLGRFAPPSQKFQVDVRLDEVVLKTLEKEPSRRYQHASEVKTDVEHISRGPQATAEPAPAPERSGPIDPAAKQRVAGPAIGLLVTGILDCLSMPLLALVLTAVLWRLGWPAGAGPLELPARSFSDFVSLFLPGLSIALGWLALGLVIGVLIIIGAVQMKRVRSSGWARTSAILAMLPLPNPVTWFLGLPMGIWALVVLRRPDVRAAFASAAAQQQDAAKEPAERLRRPAIGLLVAAIVSLAASLVAIPGFSRLREVVPIEHWAIVLIFMGAVAYGVLLFVPAIALLGQRWRWVAVAGNIFAMLPISPAVVIGAPAAICGLVALARPEVRAAFAAEAEKAAMGAPSRRQARRMGLALAGWLAVGAAAAVLAVVLLDEYVPRRYIVQDECHMDPIPATMPVPGSAGTWSAHRGYTLECHATGEGWTWGRPPLNRGLNRQRLVLRFLPPNLGSPVGVLGQMEIDLRTLGYKYRGRDGVETAAETGLDPKVILAWMKAGGAGELVAGPGFPAELLKEVAPDGPRARAEAANLNELARNWRWQFPEERIDRSVFVLRGGSVKDVARVPWVEPAVWIVLAAAWLALGVLWLRRVRRPQAKVSLAVAGGDSAGGPAVTQEAASKEPLPPEQRGSAQGGLPPQAAAQRPGKGRRTRPAWLVAGAIVGALLLLAVPIVGGLVAWRLGRHPDVKPAKELNLGGGVTMELVLIRPGKFIMGSPDSEKGRVVHEGPQHEVTISKPFYMGVTEVTQAQYQAIMGTNPSNFEGEKNPVEKVSWNDATQFCKKLSERTGRTVRLPTEAEWEYACRAGSKTRFCFGDADADLGDYAWSEANSGGTTHPVGQKEPNAWGLYDMHGNLCEWCADWYGDYPNGPVTDPQGPASGTYRVLRGGCWLTAPSVDRSALRVLDPPIKRTTIYGFRVVVSVPGSPAPMGPAEHPSVMSAPATVPTAGTPLAPAAPTAAAPPELTLDLGGVTMKMVLIPAGKFMMGEEKDRHEVTLSNPFYVGVTEVTQAQYEAVMGTNPSHFKGATNPVEMVSCYDATEFCKKLSEKTRQAVRLTTEAEWEYACRAGTVTAFSFGDADSGLGDYAWYGANSGDRTHPVGQKKPNAWGLYDMHGNVWEWCADWYGDYPKGVATDPQGPASGPYRVLRGGGWGRVPSHCRSACRFNDPPDHCHGDFGFRVVVSVSGSPAAAAPATDD